jgi:hypothetical protein
MVQDWVDAEGRAGLMRKIGGLLFGVGMFMVFIRKGSNAFGEGWGSFALLLTLAIPTVLLYWMGLNGDQLQPPGNKVGELAPWRVVFLVFGVLLVPVTLSELIDWLGGTPGTALNLIWVFGLTAFLASFASHQTKATYMTLLFGLAGIVVWTAFWDKIVDNSEHLGTYRWLLLLLALIYALMAVALTQRDADGDERRAAELITVSGIAAVIAGALSLSAIGNLTGGFVPVPSGADSTLIWEVILLLVSVKLIAWGTYKATRGPTYVGAIGLFLFVIIAGLDLNSKTPHGKIIGWPLLLLIVGIGLLVASFRPERTSRIPRPSMPDIPRPGS